MQETALTPPTAPLDEVIVTEAVADVELAEDCLVDPGPEQEESKNPLVSVKQSPIHGKGLFAAVTIEEDALIGLYEGPKVEYEGPYVLWVEDEDENLIGIDGQSETRYVNHSVEPNAAFYGEELYALREIQPGEEITHHYGDDWEDVL